MNAPFPNSNADRGSSPDQQKPLNLLIAAPRGFCAGVDRAIEIVEKSLERYGAPVYVRHEIVHNKYVVEGLKAKGAISSRNSTKCRRTLRWCSARMASPNRSRQKPSAAK